MAFRRFVSARSCTVSFVATCLSTAPGLFRTVAAMMAPCSVNASGRFRVPPQLDVANCDIKFRTSSSETSKMKSAGNLCWFRRTCSLRRRVSTPYRAARSRYASCDLACSLLRDFFAEYFQISRLCVEVHSAIWHCFQSNGSAGRAADGCWVIYAREVGSIGEPASPHFTTG